MPAKLSLYIEGKVKSFSDKAKYLLIINHCQKITEKSTPYTSEKKIKLKQGRNMGGDLKKGKIKTNKAKHTLGNASEY